MEDWPECSVLWSSAMKLLEQSSTTLTLRRRESLPKVSFSNMGGTGRISKVNVIRSNKGRQGIGRSISCAGFDVVGVCRCIVSSKSGILKVLP